MQNTVASARLLAKTAASCLLFLLFSAGPARAQTNSESYTLFVASGFLCDSNQSPSCLAVAKSPNGDTYEISGAGAFSPLTKSVKAAGAFSHRASNGNMLETGVWIASDLVSFSSYGTAPATVLPKGPAFGNVQSGPRRPLMSPGAAPTGGLAVFHVLLIPVSGTSKTAVLQVNSALGDVPRERSMEGIRLSLNKNSVEYSEEASGRVMFLATKSAARTSGNPLQ